MAENDDDAPLSPEASLALIAKQQDATHRGLDVDSTVLLAPWGVAWLFGYGLLFLRYGPDERVLVQMPAWLPLAALFTLLAAAGLVSSIGLHKATRGVAGESAERGVMYGWSWFIAFASFGVISWRFEEFLPPARFSLLMGALPVLITGTLYMSGGAVWRDRRQFAFGVWLSAVNALGVVAGPGWHSMLVALFGGGAMLAVAAFDRMRRPAAPAATALPIHLRPAR